MYDLSILIPALREEFLLNTVQDILKNKRGKTEVIVGLDGEWASPGLPDHPDLKIIYSSKNLGQRGMTNLLCKLSRAKYVAKCDAHVALDEGFDTKLMEAMKGHDDWTIVPAMRNLHVFNWQCQDCGDETYQGPEPEGCKSCDVNTPDRFKKKIVWYAKPSPKSTAYRFTPDRLQFKYFGALKKYQTEEIAETMSLQGSFFMLTRDKYWELNICDESWGGWGQQGTEVALKTWLSGGRVVCHTGTWYAHMFRTQHGFAFPWGNPARQQQKAREKCMELFFKNQWDKQVRPLSWVLERFWDALQEEQYQPDKGDRPWTQEDLQQVKSTEGRFNGQAKGIIYFTDNQLPMKYAWPVRRQIRKCAEVKNMSLVSASLKPVKDMGKNIVIKGERGYLTMFKQILAALEASTADIIFMCEHDVLYPPEHFDFTPPDKNTVYYDHNWWKVHPDGKAFHWDADQVSGLCAYRDVLIKHYRGVVDNFDPKTFKHHFEPMSRQGSQSWKASIPHIDIRHGHNLTAEKRSLADFRNPSTANNWQESTIENIPYWDKLPELLQ